MKGNIRIIVYLMIVAVAAGGVWLWSQSADEEEILGRLDPADYDAAATCIGIDGSHLICNEGNDIYLCLDGADVYMQKSRTVIEENGDEEITVSYKTASLDRLKKEIEEEGAAVVNLWLTENGKVSTIMICIQSFENRNESLSQLNGLDPDSYTAEAAVLDMDSRGMRLAPVGYLTGDGDKLSGMAKDYTFGRKTDFYICTVTVTVDEDGTRHRNIRYEASDYSAVRSRLGQDLRAHIWFTGYGNIYAVMIMEEKIVLK
ncbi:MAG: hypothetical protein ACI4LA_02805 [Emergencia sp.]